MAKKSLRAQLNQIRAWVRQGRTDAWIAHQLEVSTAELREFRRRHELEADGEENGEIDLRDEIEAEIEAATLAAEEEEDELDEEEDEAGEEEDEADEEEEEAGEEGEDEDDEPVAGEPADAAAADGEQQKGEEEGAPRRRRRRRGGRGRGGKRGAKPLEATFDHGDKDGYGLWLDPAVADNPTYTEHWRGHRAVEVEVTPDQIVIRRVESK